MLDYVAINELVLNRFPGGGRLSGLNTKYPGPHMGDGARVLSHFSRGRIIRPDTKYPAKYLPPSG
jgi:hypothetical protein